MERFIGTVEDDDAVNQLWRAIKGKGAFRYFKDTAHRLGLLEQWYGYRDEAMKECIVAWAEANNVPIVDDAQNRRQNSDIRCSGWRACRAVARSVSEERRLGLPSRSSQRKRRAKAGPAEP